MPIQRLALCLCLLLSPLTTHAEPSTMQWHSGSQQTTLLELYTSEGCSSCPVAERWLSRWLTRDELWHEVVPLAFHVDYWDSLGWIDRYAQAAFTQRQHRYQQQGHSHSVYTPGFMVNGQEWRGFFSRKPLPVTSLVEVGVLQAQLLAPAQLMASFAPLSAQGQELTLHVALLGMNIHSPIKAGENKGRQLQHDFVVLQHYQQHSAINHSDIKQQTYHWQLSLSPMARAQAIALWVTEKDKMLPLQATGGWLKPATI